MKKTILTFSLLLLLCQVFKAQDTLILKSGIKLKGYVKDTLALQVKYQKPADTVHFYFVSKQDLQSIHFYNGAIITYYYLNKDLLKQNYVVKDNEMFKKGNADALRYYNHPCGAAVTGVTSFLTGGIVGLIPAIAFSTKTPKEINLGYPDPELFKNSDYKYGYVKTAKKIKQKKIWRAYGIGLGCALLVGIYVSSHNN